MITTGRYQTLTASSFNADQSELKINEFPWVSSNGSLLLGGLAYGAVHSSDNVPIPKRDDDLPGKNTDAWVQHSCSLFRCVFLRGRRLLLEMNGRRTDCFFREIHLGSKLRGRNSPNNIGFYNTILRFGFMLIF